MGRYSTNPSYNQRIVFMGKDWYRLFWTCDRYYKDSRQRFPRQFSRDTDEKGAIKFCKKWGLNLPYPHKLSRSHARLQKT